MRRRAKIEIRIKTYSGQVVPIILYSHTTGLGLDSVSSREKKKGVKGSCQGHAGQKLMYASTSAARHDHAETTPLLISK